jgi:hypothetical protein
MPRKLKPGQEPAADAPFRLYAVPCTMLIGSRSAGTAAMMADHVASVAGDLSINGFNSISVDEDRAVEEVDQFPDGSPIELDDHGNIVISGDQIEAYIAETTSRPPTLTNGERS